MIVSNLTFAAPSCQHTEVPKLSKCNGCPPTYNGNYVPQLLDILI